MGIGGEIVLYFSEDITDDLGDDICIYEVGGAVEPTSVYISDDNINWIYVGTTNGGTYSLDIANYVDTDYSFRYLKIKDLGTRTDGRWPGADLDAVSVFAQDSYNRIYNAEDLIAINNNLTGKYILMNDIDLVGIDWVPLGTSSSPFTGTLNGDGFKIKNLTINAEPASYQGLFTYLNSAVIENLEVEDAKLDVKGVHAGIISGYARNTSFKNVSISGNSYLNNTYYNNGSFAGTSTYSAYENCYTNARIKTISSDAYSTASIFGLGQHNTVKNTYSTGNVYGAYATAFMHSHASNKVENSYYAGVTNAVTAYGSSVVSNSYYNSDLAISAKDLTRAKTTDEMKKKSTFGDWDFTNVWEIDEGSDYPLPYLNKNMNTKSSYFNGIEISTVDDLKNINKDLGNNYRLANDINLTGIDWVPLGTSSSPFTGTLNGDGFKIKNLTINAEPASYQGLFTYLNSAVIENLEVEDAKLDVKGVHAGIISGYARNTSFKNVSISGNSYLNNTYYNNGSFAGTSTYSAYENCYTNARIKTISSDAYSTASIFGLGQHNTVKNTYSTGNVYGAYATAFMHSHASNKVENSYYAGVTNAVTAYGSSVVSNSYYNSDLAISAKDLTRAKTTDEMKKKSTFGDWDFTNVWEIDEGSDYPLPYLNKNMNTKSSYFNGIEISTVDDLKNINKDLGNNYRLANDINLTGIDWVPLGTSSSPFTGTLNGNGFKIKNLRINSQSGGYKGLFAYLNSAVIENLEVEDAKLDVKGVHAGIISGCARNTSFKNVSISGNSYLNNTYYNNGSFAGTSTYSAYENCYTNARIKTISSDAYSTASIFGLGQHNTVKNTYSTGNVYGAYATAFMHSHASNKVENSYYAGVTNAVTAYGSSVVSNSYYNSDLAISAKDLTRAKTTDEMKKKSTFGDWDFTNVWEIDEGSDYPLPYLNKNMNTKSSYFNGIEISTVDDLKNINKDLGNNYRLANDINLTGIDWVPLGTSSSPFTGTLNGDGFKIKNLTINAEPASYQGLFTYLNSAVIENLEVEDAKLDVKGVHAGIISGYARNTSFKNVSISGNSYLNNTYYNNGSFAGTSTYSAYENCYTNARIKTISSDAYSTASIFGLGQHNTVKNAYSTGNVYGAYATAFMHSHASNKVENSYYAGVTNAVTAYGSSVVSNSYYNSDLAISAKDLTRAKTTDEMKKKSTFGDWDFTGVWEIDEGVGYPTLKEKIQTIEKLEKAYLHYRINTQFTKKELLDSEIFSEIELENFMNEFEYKYDEKGFMYKETRAIEGSILINNIKYSLLELGYLMIPMINIGTTYSNDVIEFNGLPANVYVKYENSLSRVRGDRIIIVEHNLFDLLDHMQEKEDTYLKSRNLNLRGYGDVYKVGDIVHCNRFNGPHSDNTHYNYKNPKDGNYHPIKTAINFSGSDCDLSMSIVTACRGSAMCNQSGEGSAGACSTFIKRRFANTEVKEANYRPCPQTYHKHDVYEALFCTPCWQFISKWGKKDDKSKMFPGHHPME